MNVNRQVVSTTNHRWRHILKDPATRKADAQASLASMRSRPNWVTQHVLVKRS